jgi:gluconokinase
VVIVLMGVSGSGKTTVGTLLAHELRWKFADGDDYHSAANVEKMRSGVPLTDADRGPWLDTLRSLVADWLVTDSNAVLACSALRAVYRQRLRIDSRVNFVYLKADAKTLSERLLHRPGHYMKEPMLQSQLATLEEPEDAITVNAADTPDQIVRDIRRRLQFTQDPGNHS